MLTPTIPIFPLPNVVLFPSVFLPLHIFEPRYRRMLADALAGDRLIGMVLLKNGCDPAPGEAAPPVYDVGCAGLISHAERLPDGRSNIVLRGVERFRIVGELDGRAYRRAQIAPLPEPDCGLVRGELHRARNRLGALLAARRFNGAGWNGITPDEMPDEDLVNTLAQYLDLEPVEKQALLERNDIASRSHTLIELLEMRTLTAQPGGLRPQ